MTLVKRIFQLGVLSHYPEQLKSRIKAANVYYFIVFWVALGFGIMDNIQFPALAVFNPTFCAITLLALGLNYLNQHRVSRVIMAIAPSFLLSLQHGTILKVGEQPIFGLTVLMVSISIIPWILFDFRERWLLAPTLLVCYLNILLLPVYNRVFEVDFDTTLFRSAGMELVLTSIGLSVTGLLLFQLKRRTYIGQKTNLGLVKDLEEQKGALTQHQAELENTMKEISAARKEEQDRAWIGESIGSVNDLLRKAPTLEALYPPLIKEWVSNAGAFRGVLYIRSQQEDDEGALRLVASYAVLRKDDLPEIVREGEGQVGMVMRNKKHILLQDPPDAYVHVGSGLGETKAKTVLIFPLLSNKVVEGVVELAALDVLEERVIKYMDESATIVAATLQNLFTNENTRNLLETSQEQAENLRSQEEEMRQNVEELQATQEEMRRKEQEYLNTIQELRNILTEKIYGKKGEGGQS